MFYLIYFEDGVPMGLVASDEVRRLTVNLDKAKSFTSYDAAMSHEAAFLRAHCVGSKRVARRAVCVAVKASDDAPRASDENKSMYLSDISYFNNFILSK